MAKQNRNSEVEPSLSRKMASGLSRRDFFKVSGGGAALLLSPAAMLLSADPAQANKAPHVHSIWMYDPEVIGSTLPPKQFDKVVRIPDEQKNAWRTLRSFRETHEGTVAVSGVSRWSDFLIVRGHLESCGMRLVESVENSSVFYWHFVSRSSLHNVS